MLQIKPSGNVTYRERPAIVWPSALVSLSKNMTEIGRKQSSENEITSL